MMLVMWEVMSKIWSEPGITILSDFEWPANAVEHKHQWPVKKLGSGREISISPLQCKIDGGSHKKMLLLADAIVSIVVSLRWRYNSGRPTNQWCSVDFSLFRCQVWLLRIFSSTDFPRFFCRQRCFFAVPCVSPRRFLNSHWPFSMPGSLRDGSWNWAF